MLLNRASINEIEDTEALLAAFAVSRMLELAGIPVTEEPTRDFRGARSWKIM